jgi:hypothetical protein
MSGAYTENFGNRMKSYPKRAIRKQQQRKPFWCRIKSHSSVRWVYFRYEGSMADFPDFAKGIVGRMRRQMEILDGRPEDLNKFPFSQHRGVDLFLEML